MPRISQLIAPSFYGVHHALRQKRYTHYWLKGGRGSCKSSFVSLEIILGMIQHPYANAVCIRKVGIYLKDSVYEQLLWAIEKLEVAHLWECRKAPMEMVYRPTGQKILFRGADSPGKLKSTKVAKGYISYIWYEECDEFAGREEIDNINQSLLRGGEVFRVFYSYNPPRSVRSWVNAPPVNRTDTLTHHSTYESVPRHWLGEQFIAEAEHLKRTNLQRYKHEYLGVVTGTGGEIFTNLLLRPIGQAEIATFDKIRRGLDWGYATDPLHYTVCYYDSTHKKIYVYFEIHKSRMSNSMLAEEIKKENSCNQLIVADSAEPKSIADLQSMGVRIIAAKKGMGSVEHGIRFLAEEVEQIIIDPARCPHTAREFSHYELEKDGQGGFKAAYPDKDNHSIDALRYALEGDMSRKRVEFLK